MHGRGRASRKPAKSHNVKGMLDVIKRSEELLIVCPCRPQYNYTAVYTQQKLHGAWGIHKKEGFELKLEGLWGFASGLSF